jgi:hypothetical protein
MELVEQLAPFFVRPIDRFVVGLDIGQSAACAVRCTVY